MTTTPSQSSPVFDEPRIGRTRFLGLLKSKNAPAAPSAYEIYDIFVGAGLEPSFALAQYRVESQYGTAGFAVTTRSWGNSLYSEFLTTRNVGTYKRVVDGTTYVYATYDDFVAAALDYTDVHKWYRDKYGLISIYDACGRWLGPRNAGSAGHEKYVSIIVNDMILYAYPEGTFYETGDTMISTGAAIDRTTGKLHQKYFVPKGTQLYRGTVEANTLKILTPTDRTIEGLDLWWLGPVNSSWDWGAVLLGPAGDAVYIKNPIQANVKEIV